MRKTKSFLHYFLVLSAGLLIFVSYACDTPSNGGCGGPSTCNYDTCSEGPYDTTYSLTSGPRRDSGVFYPRNISSQSETFPVLVFGCGGGSQPRAYVDHGNMIASHGYIIVFQVSTGTGTELTNAIAWLTQQNNNRSSDLYGKVDLDHIAAGGHSMGSISTFAIADDPRLTTTIHVAGGSFDGNGYRNLRNPTIYISGDSDMALSNCQRDYRNTNNVPVFFTVQRNVDHIACAREGLPAIIAWMHWHLKGETERSAEFLESGGEFTVGKWQSQSKNW